MFLASHNRDRQLALANPRYSGLMISYQLFSLVCKAMIILVLNNFVITLIGDIAHHTMLESNSIILDHAYI